MRDKLDGLSAFFIKMSRFPGLGFLEEHARSLMNMKHTAEGHISNFEAQKQGVEQGFEAIKEAGGGKSKSAGNTSKPTSGTASHYPPVPPQPSASASSPGTASPGTAGPYPGQTVSPGVAPNHSHPNYPSGPPAPAIPPESSMSKEAKAKQKLARKLQKRRR